MKKAMNAEIVRHKGQVVAVYFGADAAAEHEVGIAPLRKLFDLTDDRSKFGAEYRLARARPESLQWFQFTTDSGDHAEGFACGVRPWWKPDMYSFSFPGGIFPDRPKATLASAWSDSDFAICSTNPKEIADLKQVFDAANRQMSAFGVLGFTRYDLVIGGTYKHPKLGSDKGCGLALGIASRLPFFVTSEWVKADKEKYEATVALKKTGIEQKIKDAGLSFYALSNYHVFEDGVWRVWLNPTEQQQYNSGWWTIAELEAWTRGEGPVVWRCKCGSTDRGGWFAETCFPCARAEKTANRKNKRR